MDLGKTEQDELDELYFYEQEETEVKIFQKFVTPHYKPYEEPVAMAVGAILPTEKSVIKAYNSLQFGIPIKKTKVAACNIHDMPPSMKTLERFRYDHGCFNQYQGDARSDYPFMSSLGLFERFDRRFDLIYIRNPDFVSLESWAHIFCRALEWTASDGGAVVTLVRQTDVKKYETLLDILKQDFSIEPKFSGETGISCGETYPFNENFQHTIGIFNPTHNY
jgi:hypothetical protein